ncbi:MAG: D-arabinono-1,4-lactone oxidase [Gemmatimonadota bacterium]|nr:D-arabinono-1,4-lactone oxidase [Gemmatimonadota bacterium]
MSGVRRLHVRGEEEVVAAVREARDAGFRLRVAGAGGSKSAVNAPADVVLHLEGPLAGLPGDGTAGDGTAASGTADGGSPAGRLVTVPAGLTTGALHRALRARGLSLPTVGEWTEATMAGSLATATHGGSARHGIMATSVHSVRLVDGRGEIVELAAGDPDFAHAAVSLGAFGALTSVTFRCEERFRLRLATDVIPFEEYLRDPVAHESASEFHASVWVTSARRVVRFAADRTSAGAGRPPVPRRERFGRRTAVATLLSRRLGIHGGRLFDRLFRHTAEGESGAILSPLEVPARVARFRNVANRVRRRLAVELAIPAGDAADALPRFEELFRRDPGPLNNPIGLRMNPADRFTLSPCVERDTLWLDIFCDDRRRFVERLAALAEEVDARCHWGKSQVLPPAYLRGAYPGWEDFRAARARFDPDEVFANRFTDALGLTGPGDPA